ncbi:MAG: winged helix DNA-binding protein [Cypionkella sp.]
MGQADFSYGPGGADALACVAAVYAADPAGAAALRDDVAAAGYGVVDYDLLAEVHGAAGPLPGDVLVVDCPQADGATIAALMQLDLRAGAAAHPLIVCTSIAALDTVFACLDRSAAQVLVEPTTGERVIALGRALTMIPRMAVREREEADRVALLRLTEQVAEVARQIDRLASGQPRAFRLESPNDDFAGDDGERALIRPPRPPLPDPRLVRRIIRQRRLRADYFGQELFADPAWDILLDLTAARAEHVRVSVTSLCIASGVPPTTALRWIGQMTEAGLLEREDDDSDRRRAFIRLSDRAADAMARYFAELGKDARSLI